MGAAFAAGQPLAFTARNATLVAAVAGAALVASLFLVSRLPRSR